MKIKLYEQGVGPYLIYNIAYISDDAPIQPFFFYNKFDLFPVRKRFVGRSRYHILGTGQKQNYPLEEPLFETRNRKRQDSFFLRVF